MSDRQGRYQGDFAPLFQAIKRAPQADLNAQQEVTARDSVLTKPPGSLGRLEEIASWLAQWQASPRPRTECIHTLVFAGNHGVTAQGVSAFPPQVTHQMVANFLSGGAAINQICKTFDLELAVVDMQIETPTKDFTTEPAMTACVCESALHFGMECVPKPCDVLVIGEMGIGNTTVAAALFSALFGGEAHEWVGRGSGVDQEGLKRKINAVTSAIARCQKNGCLTPFHTLAEVGGHEIAGMAGALIQARCQRTPVIIDGYVASAAAAVVFAHDPEAIAHCIFSHCSAEQAHIKALGHMRARALLDLDMRLGEASGAALAASLIKAAANLHNGMSTFAEANVSDKL